MPNRVAAAEPIEAYPGFDPDLTRSTATAISQIAGTLTRARPSPGMCLERAAVGLRGGAEPLREVVPQSGRAAETGPGGDRVDPQVRVLEQLPGEEQSPASR
jgi:hypothetical protein